MNKIFREIYSIRQAAASKEIPAHRIGYWIDRGFLRAHKIERTTLIAKEDWKQFLRDFDISGLRIKPREADFSNCVDTEGEAEVKSC